MFPGIFLENDPCDQDGKYGAGPKWEHRHLCRRVDFGDLPAGKPALRLRHRFFLRQRLSGNAVSSAPESAFHLMRPSASTRTMVPVMEPRKVWTRSPGLK